MCKNVEVMRMKKKKRLYNFRAQQGPCVMMHEPRLAEGVFIKLGC